MKVIVICQYRENYSFNSDGSPNTENPHFKNKGSHEFVIDLAQCDIDAMSYINGSHIIEPMIQDIVKNECNEIAQYDILSITPQFSEPTDLTEKFKGKFYSIENFEVVS